MKIYIVKANIGEYSDKTTYDIVAFTTKEKANEIKAKLFNAQKIYLENQKRLKNEFVHPNFEDSEFAKNLPVFISKYNKKHAVRLNQLMQLCGKKSVSSTPDLIKEKADLESLKKQDYAEEMSVRKKYYAKNTEYEVDKKQKEEEWIKENCTQHNTDPDITDYIHMFQQYYQQFYFYVSEVEVKE